MGDKESCEHVFHHCEAFECEICGHKEFANYSLGDYQPTEIEILEIFDDYANDWEQKSKLPPLQQIWLEAFVRGMRFNIINCRKK